MTLTKNLKQIGKERAQRVGRYNTQNKLEKGELYFYECVCRWRSSLCEFEVTIKMRMT